MTIQEMIEKTDLKDVIEKIEKHYGNEYSDKYIKLYELLKNTNVNTNLSIMTIFIQALKEVDDDVICINKFDENDTTLTYDVSATTYKDTIVYSIASVSYSDFLGYYISEDTLNKFSHSSILAHCLWEITTYSFEDNI